MFAILKQFTVLLVLTCALSISDAGSDAIDSGTSFVIALTDQGIVFGADVMRLRSFTDDPRRHELVPMLTTPKFKICGTDVVCGVAGSSAIEFGALPNDSAEVRKCGHFKYDFDDWLTQIETEALAGGQASPAMLAKMIWGKGQSSFSQLSCYMKLPQGQFLNEGDGPFMFLVAGYPQASELPEFYAIKVQLDPDKKDLRFPEPEKVFPQSKAPALPCIFFAGYQAHMEAARKLLGPEGSSFSSFLPHRKLLAKAVFSDASPLLQETAATVATYLDVESEFNPIVGGGSSIMVLRKGKRTLLAEIPPLSTNH